MRAVKCLIALVTLSVGGCGSDANPPPADETGRAQLTITQVPAGVGCLRVTAAGTRSVQQEFAVAPGQTSVLDLQGLPVGLVDFSGAAFNTSCPPAPNSVPSWLSEPASATLSPSTVPTITLVMRENARAKVDVDFSGEPACLASGAACSNNAACCSRLCVKDLSGQGTCQGGGGNPPSENVLVAASPNGGATWRNDVQAKLVATGAFTNVDVMDLQTTTPTLPQLQAYRAVLVFSDASVQDANLLGNVLADYFDGGGRVVVATFANAGSLALSGRWASDGYQLIDPNVGQTQPSETAPLIMLDPGSPLLSGVSSLTAQSAYRSAGNPINGAIVVAQWGSGAPLILRGVKNGRQYAELNMYPPSSAVSGDFWVGSGAEIMRNALLFQ